MVIPFISYFQYVACKWVLKCPIFDTKLIVNFFQIQVGLLYDEVSLQSLLDITADWTPEERQMLRNKVIWTPMYYLMQLNVCTSVCKSEKLEVTCFSSFNLSLLAPVQTVWDNLEPGIMCVHLHIDWSRLLSQLQNYLYQVPKTGLKTPFRDGLLRHVAEDVVKLAKVKFMPTLQIILFPISLAKWQYVFILLQDGLERRGFKESGFLNEVAEVVRTGKPDSSRLKLYISL